MCPRKGKQENQDTCDDKLRYLTEPWQVVYGKDKSQNIVQNKGERHAPETGKVEWEIKVH
jgi:hypothetical protein